MNGKLWRFRLLLAVIFCLLALPACTTGEAGGGETASANTPSVGRGEMLALPDLTAVDLNGDRLRVVATTSIIGDVVARVGGEAIHLTTLMEPGQDPHGFEPSARRLTAVAGAHVIFVNGWNLEEALVRDLAEVGKGVPMVAISANIAPLGLADGASEHENEVENGQHKTTVVDPHVWFSIHNVEQWVENVAHVLSTLEPANAPTFERNAAAYLAELTELERYVAAELAQIPPENRFLVTNHDSLGYFARDYGFTIVGTVIPGRSTLAEPSASDLAGLIAAMADHNLCTIFTETTVSDSLAQTAANELKNCAEVAVISLYTGTIGPPGSGADSYIGMYRANVDAIVAGLTG